MKLDMHCHTREGSPDGRLPLSDNIALLKQKGYQGMLIADHNSYKAYRYYQKMKDKPKDFVVLKGIEYDTFNAGHMLIIMPTGVNLPILELRGLPLILLIEIVHFYGGILGPAHPCGERFLSMCNSLGGKLLEHACRKFDFVEGYNACEDADSNIRAMALAKKYGLPCLGGSDSHKGDCAGLGYTLLQEDIANETELIRYIRAGKKTVIGGRHYANTTKAKLGRMNHILVYSFWFYNKGLALLRRKARRFEMMENQILASLRANNRKPTRYILLGED